MSWSPEIVALVRERADLVRVAAKLVTVQPGLDGQPIGICPFHRDSTGTLELVPQDAGYHCGVCGAHGDLFSLAQARRGLTYQQAVAFVAEASGIDLAELTTPELRDDLHHAMRAAYELATSYYEEQLWSPAGAPALEYLRGRGISDEQIRQFRLGWADGYFLEHALARGLSTDLLRQADLAHLDGERLRDRYWSRVTVPILDHDRRPIAFSARLLPAEEARRRDAGRPIAKYVNSTDTAIYQKGNSVFNLRKAVSASRKAKRLILVEGALDVIACTQTGFPEALACLGTAFTADQARLLVERNDGSVPVVVALDGDNAGKAKRAGVVKQLLAVGASVQVVELPDGDPTSLLLGDGELPDVAAFRVALAQQKPGTAWFLQQFCPQPECLDDGQRLGLYDELLALVAQVADPTYRSLFGKRAAKHLGIDQVTAKKKEKIAAARDAAQDERLALTDYGNAQRFLAKCAGAVLYCRDWSSWVVWTGKRWEVDDANDTLTWALYHDAMDRHLAEEIGAAVRVNNPGMAARLRSWRETSDSTASHKSALEQACRLRELQARSRDFDRDPYLFTCANGTLDLRTGELLKHNREHHITRLADADWHGPEAQDDRWNRYVAHLVGNADTLAYLRRFAGYSATAITTEKAIVILQGDGNSGKTVFVNALQNLFGTYAGSLNAENFLTQQQPTKKWELANCDSARFVVIEEVGTEGRGFAIDFLKAATGGNQITGERKFGQPYSFRPVWKLLFVCNDTPSAPAGDNATWNRINLIHAEPPPKVLDKTLGDHFRTPEARSAILAWVVAGARDYLARGDLAAPEQVRLATQRHRHDCDYLTQYLDESWVPTGSEADVVAVGDFLADFHPWCKQHGHYALSARAIVKRLMPLGIKADEWVYSTDKQRTVRGWAGFRRRSAQDQTWSQAMADLPGSPRNSHTSATGGEIAPANATDATSQADRIDLADLDRIATGNHGAASADRRTPADSPRIPSVATSVATSVARPTDETAAGNVEIATEATDNPRVTRTREGSDIPSSHFSRGEVQGQPSDPWRASEPPAGEPPMPPAAPGHPPVPPSPRSDRLRKPPGDDEQVF